MRACTSGWCAGQTGAHERPARRRHSPRYWWATRPRWAKGDVCIVQGSTSAEPLVQAVYEEVLRAGGLPIIQMTTEEAAAAFYSLASDDQLDWVPPPAEWAAENADVRIADDGRGQHARPHAGGPEEAGPGAEGAPAPDGDLDAPLGGRRVPLGAHALPDPRLRKRGGDVAHRLRGLLLHGLSRHRLRSPDRVAAPVGRGASAWPTGWRARRRCTSRRPGTDIKLGVAGRTWIPCVGEHNMPDGEFFTGPVEDSVEGEVAFAFPATYGGREVSGVRFRFEGGTDSGRLRRARRGASSTRCSTPTTALAAWASSASGPTTGSRRARRRSCSTRRSAGPCTWRSA